MLFRCARECVLNSKKAASTIPPKLQSFTLQKSAAKKRNQDLLNPSPVRNPTFELFETQEKALACRRSHMTAEVQCPTVHVTCSKFYCGSNAKHVP